MGAMQAQDEESAKWAVGLRCRGVDVHTVERAIANGRMVRTWLVRGTLHFAAGQDVRWLLALVGPRLITANARRDRQLELDEKTYTRSAAVLKKVLGGGKVLTRRETLAALQQEGIEVNTQRGYHLLRRAGLEGLICFGPKQGKQETIALLDGWATDGPVYSREEALAEIARRYFQSHGPATLADFTWWSGLVAGEARSAMEMIQNEVIQKTLDDQVYYLSDPQPAPESQPPNAHLLPAYDEYYLGYKDRSAVLDPAYDRLAVSNNGVFRPVIVINGQVRGTWRRTVKGNTLKISLEPFETLTGPALEALEIAAEQYGGTFLDLEVVLER